MQDYLWVLKDSEKDLMREIEPERMNQLDEDGLIALHRRVGEIRETIFIGLRSVKATVRNDTKIHRSITGRENSGTC